MTDVDQQRILEKVNVVGGARSVQWPRGTVKAYLLHLFKNTPTQTYITMRSHWA